MESESSATFRDRPINLDNSGKRKWIYAKQPSGKCYRRRTVAGWLAIAFLVLAPFIKINGNPLMLFDIANRKFSIFGQIIWAQDAYLLALIMAVTVVFIVLFTVVYGRLWCGWACPQTVFLEMIFRRIEYLFEGNYRKGPVPNKVTSRTPLMKIAKHAVFLLTAIIITNVFLNWIVGPERLMEIISSPISENRLGFTIMLGISLFYYWIYAFFREQVCTMICPYGRIQGTLIDSRTITVIYDYKRGEPRGPKSSGDCINCSQCVAVCPTGIDIKNGSQLECINCTACIDECNLVMDRIRKPKNLIRFDSVQGVENGIRSVLNARTYAYSAVLIILIIVLSVTVSNRKPIETSILRVSGSLYQQVDSLTYSNLFLVKIINKTQSDKELKIRLISPESGRLKLTTGQSTLKKQEILESVLIVELNRQFMTGNSTPVRLGIFEGETLLQEYSTNFLGPEK